MIAPFFARLRLPLGILVAILLQGTVLPRFIADPFQPGLLLLFVVYGGLRWPFFWGVPLAWGLGLVQDTLSGLYPGLHGFSFLLVYLLLHRVAHRLYTSSRLLLVVATFLATMLCGLAELLLLALFAEAGQLTYAMLANLLPQAVLAAWVMLAVQTLLPQPGEEPVP